MGTVLARAACALGAAGFLMVAAVGAIGVAGNGRRQLKLASAGA